MDEFQRLATFKGVDPPAGVFVLSLTGAGFHRSLSCDQHQVVCHRCALLLDLRKLVARSPDALTHHGIMELHRQLSSSCPFVQQFFQNQRLSNVNAESLRDNGAAESSGQQRTRASSPMSCVVDSDFSALNGNSRGLRPLGRREERRSVTYPDRASSSSSVQTRTSSRRSTAAQRSSPNNMASGGPFSPHFVQDKPDPHLSAFACQYSVLGGPEDDDLVTDSVQDNAEEEEDPPPDTQPSDIDFGGHLNARTGARQQPPQSAPQPGWQQAGAAGGPQHQPVGLASHPGMPAQPSREREGRNSRELGGGASRASARDLAIETESAKFYDFAIESDRLRSFGGWSAESPRPEDLAEAGFFYTGCDDCVRCFYCGTGLKQWEPTDDPWVEHARMRSTCAFVRLSKSPEFLSAVQTLSERNAANPGSPAPIQLSDVEREMTNLKAQHQPTAGRDDGPEAMNGEDENDQEMANDEMQRTLERLENENRSLRDEWICKICMDRDINVGFLPCGHFVTCSTCAPVALCCPMCREAVRGTFPVRME